MSKTKRIKNLKISKALKQRHKAKVQEKINTEPDFVYSKKFNHSMLEMLQKYPDGVPDNVIMKVLKLKPNQFQILFSKILTKLRETLS